MVRAIMIVLVLSLATLVPHSTQVHLLGTASADIPARSVGNITIHAIDVEQGDCTLVVSPTGTTMLIDAGEAGMGSWQVVPYLQELGIASLDYVLVTHYHSDHLGGMDEVLAQVPLTGLAYDRGGSYSTSAYTEYVNAVGSSRRSMTVGQVVDLGGGAEVRCVGKNGCGVPSVSDENDLCLVLVVSFGNFDFFIGGDIAGYDTSSYVDVETAAAPMVGDVEVLRVNHHGSRYSSNQYFLDTLSPQASIISVGSNGYGHPTPEALARLENAESYVYLTNMGSGGLPSPEWGRVVGDVVVESDGEYTFEVDGDQYSVDWELAPPNIVSGPSADVSNESAVISWHTDEPATSIVQYGESSVYGMQLLSSALVSSHQMTITGLEPGRAYHYRVGSVDALANGPTWSQDKLLTTDPNPSVTSGPSAASVDEVSATVVWSTDIESMGWLQWGEDDGYGNELAESAYGTSHSLTVEGLQEGRQVHFRVMSSTQEGYASGWTPDSTFTTESWAPQILGGPSSVTTNFSATVSWTTHEESTSLMEYGPSSSYGHSAYLDGYVLEHSVTVVGLDGGMEYHCRVGSVDALGNGPTWSQDHVFTTAVDPDVSPPAIILPIEVEVGSDSAIVSWYTDEPGTSILEYGPDAGYGTVVEFGGHATHHVVSIGGLESESTYHFRVGSVDVSGNGPTWSLDQSFVTEGEALEPPAFVSGPAVASHGESWAVIGWATDRAANYTLRYWTTGTPYVLREAGRDSQWSVNITGLEPYGQYSFNVSVWDETGIGPATSGTLSFQTVNMWDSEPPQITGESIVATTYRSATIEWWTDENASSFVEYGETQAFGQMQSVLGYATHHIVTLYGLDQGTVYYVRPLSTDPVGQGPTIGRAMSLTTPLEPDKRRPDIESLGVSRSGVLFGEVEVSVNATDDRAVALVIYYVDGVEAHRSGAEPFLWVWDTSLHPDGEVELGAVAFDEAGNNDSASIALTLDNPDPPEVFIESHANGSSIAGVALFEGRATDPDSWNHLANVSYRVDAGEWRRVDGLEYWSLEIDTTLLDNGSHALHVMAVDTWGSEAIASLTFIVANPNLRPTVVVLNDFPGNVHGQVAIDVHAGDDKGVVKVEYRLDGGEWQLVDPSGGWSIELDTTSMVNGVHTLEFRSYDGEVYSSVHELEIDVQNAAPEENSGYLAGVLFLAIAIVLIVSMLLWLRGRKGPD